MPAAVEPHRRVEGRHLIEKDVRELIAEQDVDFVLAIGPVPMMRAVAEGHIEADADYAEELDFCLLCRNCESVCPSGVHFGKLMEHTRAALPAFPGAEGAILYRLDPALREKVFPTAR